MIYIYIFQEKICVYEISEKQLWLLFLNGGEEGGRGNLTHAKNFLKKARGKAG